VRVWDAGTGQPIGDPLTGHTGTVLAVALGSVGGREVIVSGGVDQTVRIWDFFDSDALTTIDVLAPAMALGLAQFRILCVAAGPALCTFAITR